MKKGEVKTMDSMRDIIFEEEILNYYEKVVYPTQTYKSSIDNIISKISNADSVLDIGCGTGNLLLALNSRGVNNISGIDRNEITIKRAKQKLDGRVELIFDDFLSYNFTKNFSTIIANNFLNIVENPYDVLEKAYYLLEDKGTMLISNPKRGFSLDELMQKIKFDLFSEGKFDDVKNEFASLEKFNSAISKKMNVYSPDEMRNILLNLIGFQTVSSTPIYGEQNNLFVAKKDHSHSNIMFLSDSRNEYIDKIKSIRNYCLRNLLDGAQIHSDFDESSNYFIAKRKDNDSLIGVMSYTDYSLIEKLPIEDHMPIEHLSKSKKSQIGALFGWYVLPTYRGLNIGRTLSKNAILSAREKGIKQIFTCINPEVKSYFFRLGFEQIGKEEKYNSLKATYIPLMLNFEKLNVHAL